MSDIVARARETRDKYMRLGSYAPEEELVASQDCFDTWQNDMFYNAGEIRRYEAGLYRCIQGHTSQADWTPDAATSLWTRIADPAQEWPDWIQPQGAHDAYPKGAKVSCDGKRWTSDMDDNVWAPGVAGWTEKIE